MLCVGDTSCWCLRPYLTRIIWFAAFRWRCVLSFSMYHINCKEIWNNTHSKAFCWLVWRKKSGGNRWCRLLPVDWGVSEKLIIFLVVRRGSKEEKMPRGHWYLSIYLSLFLPHRWIYLCISPMSCLILSGRSSYSCVQLRSDHFLALLSSYRTPFLLFFAVSCLTVLSNRPLGFFDYQLNFALVSLPVFHPALLSPAIPPHSLLSWHGRLHEARRGYIPWHQSGWDGVTPPVSVAATLSAKSRSFLQCQKEKPVMDAYLSMWSESEGHCVTLRNQSKKVPSTKLIAIQSEGVRKWNRLRRRRGD